MESLLNNKVKPAELKMNLSDIDKDYIQTLTSLHLNLRKSYDQYLNYQFNLEKLEISNTLLLRLKHFYSTQYLNKEFLDKKYIMAGADYFTEQLLFFIKAFLVKNRPDLQVFSEKQIQRKRGAIRPDISIWKNDEVTAIIECKTQLGWNRHQWEKEFNDRETKLKNEFKDAKAFLVVLTGENWGGFEENELLGDKYFCLLKGKWITQYEDENDIYIQIEKLLKKLNCG